MDIWQILELQPTPDQKAIKRAYAKKLKVTRPDENPREFQNLHMAYKAALEQALYWQEEQEEWESEESAHENHQQESLLLETPVAQPDILVEHPVEREILDIHQHTPASSPQAEISEYAQPDNTPEVETPASSIQESTIEQEHASADEAEPQPYTEANPYQVEGERLIAAAKDLFKQQHVPARARSWAFIIESPFILEDQFNWQLGLELLRTINQHNLNHNTPNASMVTQEALSYLNSIFNWLDNRHYVIRALGDEYNTWLDMIKENDPDEKDYANQIRGGKKLLLQQKHIPAQAPYAGVQKSSLGFSRFCAFLIDGFFLIIIIALLATGENSDQQAISKGAWGLLSLIAVFVYFCGFEASILQGTPGKKIMKLAVTTDQGEAPGFLRALLRTFCFFIFYILFSSIPAGLQAFTQSINIDFPYLSLAAQAYGIYLAARPVTLYDKISKTRVIQI